MLNQSIKFFTVFLLAFSVFAGGDDRDKEYYEALDAELATFEAQLAEDLANQAALEAFQKKLAKERAAAARSTEIYQARVQQEQMIKDRQAQLALERELAAFEAQLEADLAKQAAKEAFEEWYANFLDNKAAEEALEKELAAFEAQLEAELAAEDMMAEIIAEDERAKRLAEFQAKLEAEKAAAAASTAAYQAKVAEDKAAAAVAAAEAAAAEAAAAAAVAVAAPQISVSGSASVSYDDNGSLASTTSYDADLTFTGSVGTVGGTNTTVTIVADVDASWSLTSVDMATTIGPVTIAADMHDTDESNSDDGDGDIKVDTDDRSVTVSLAAPVGDMTISLEDDGDITLSGTWAGVTLTHNVDDDDTTGSVSIAGMDLSLTNDAGATTWSIGTTVSGVALTLDSENDVTAAFGLAGNTLTVSHFGARAEVVSTATHYSTESAAAYTTAAVSRDLTSGATLTATYSTVDDSLTLKAAVAF